MVRALNLTGKQFGKLTVIERVENSNRGESRWKCICECGKQTISVGRDLKRKHTVSCGCSRRKHGEGYSRLHTIWGSMLSRCRPNTMNGRYYFKRGIRVCDEWGDYVSFSQWANANGYSDDLTLDRIDNDKGYSPENCRWVNIETQARNKRNTVFISYDGKYKRLVEWCEELNLNYSTVYNRLSSGWTIERALSTPSKAGFKGTKR